MKKKGLEMPLVLVITAVVLIVVSLLIISITSGGLTQFFGQATEQQTEAGEQTSESLAHTQCEIWLTNQCGLGKTPTSGVKTVKIGGVDTDCYDLGYTSCS